MTDQNDLPACVERAQRLMAHAWMVRTFVKHSTEAEDFPEIMNIVRHVFDISRALETRVSDPTGYFKMLGKKFGKLKAATAQFAIDAPEVSTHTNFAQAVISMQTVINDLQSCLDHAQTLLKNVSATDEQESTIEVSDLTTGES
jgi:glutaredoxin 2